MESNTCPAPTGEPGLPTLKQEVLRIMAFGSQEPPVADPDSLTLQELRLQADSRMALLVLTITESVMTDVVEAGLSRFLYEDKPESDSWDMITALDDVGERYFVWLFRHQLGVLSGYKNFQPFLERLELYRGAYYRRSPQQQSVDRQYKSTEQLINSGIGTFTQHAVAFLHCIDATARRHRLAEAEIAHIALESPHLIISLAKLSLAQLERYTALLNEHPEALHAIVKVLPDRSGKHIAGLHPNLLAHSHRRDLLDNAAAHEHRRKQGCAAAVSLEGQPSAIENLWRLSVRGLIRAGCWGEDARALLLPATG